MEDAILSENCVRKLSEEELAVMYGKLEKKAKHLGVESVEDYVQDAFLKGLQKDSEIKFPQSYLGTAIRNKRNSDYRRKKRGQEPFSLDSVDEVKVSNATAAYDSLLHKELLEEKEAAIAALPKGQSDAYTLKMLGYRNDEICEQLNKSYWCVLKLIGRARETVNAKLAAKFLD
ncbi:MAG: sigma-70 family RNA polymerase sigma factor [Planctomycetota bacterium]